MVSYSRFLLGACLIPFHRFASSLKIAFVGDAGMKDPDHDGFGHKTMKMIEKEGVNLVIYLGDFEYWGRCRERYEVKKKKLSFPAKDGTVHALTEGAALVRYQWLRGRREPHSGWQVGFRNAGGEETLAAVAHKKWRKMKRKLRLTSGERCDGGPWDGPWEWRQFVRKHSFDFLAASGNHEVVPMDGGGPEIWADHQRHMYDLYEERIRETGRGSCRGYYGDAPGTAREYGERYSCLYGDQHVIFLGWYEGSDHSSKSSARENRERSVRFINREFSRRDAGAERVRWRYCVHHNTATKLSPGPEDYNNRLFGIADACRRYGALIVSGHYHIYGRTKMLKSVRGEPGVYPEVADEERQHLVVENQTMSIVVGNGGYTNACDGRYAGRSWMEICRAGDKYRGALIATFDDENPWKASFRFKNSLSDEVEDEFELESKLPGWNRVTNADRAHRRLREEQTIWQDGWKRQGRKRISNETSIEMYPYGNRRPFNADLQRQARLYRAVGDP